MKKFGFFQIDGGPLLSIVVPSNDADFQDGALYVGQVCRELPFDVADGVLYATARLVGDELVYLPPAPGPLHIWSDDAGAWVPDLQRAREVACARGKADRNRTEFGPFTYNGMTFDGDADAQRRISVLVSVAKTALAMGNNFTKDFTLADNTVVQLTAEDFIGIEMAKVWQVDVAFQEYRLKRAAIEAATTLEELEAIPV